MYVLSSLLLFFVGASAKKQGNFGIFNACLTKNSSLRLDCMYALCQGSPTFHCTLKRGDVVMGKASDETCKMVFPDLGPQSVSEAMNFTCLLVRKGRKEEKKLIVDYSIQKGKKRIRPCAGTTGLLHHQAPTSLVLVLSLWRFLVTDSQTT